MEGLIVAQPLHKLKLHSVNFMQTKKKKTDTKAKIRNIRLTTRPSAMLSFLGEMIQRALDDSGAMPQCYVYEDMPAMGSATYSV